MSAINVCWPVAAHNAEVVDVNFFAVKMFAGEESLLVCYNNVFICNHTNTHITVTIPQVQIGRLTEYCQMIAILTRTSKR